MVTDMGLGSNPSLVGQFLSGLLVAGFEMESLGLGFCFYSFLLTKASLLA